MMRSCQFQLMNQQKLMTLKLFTTYLKLQVNTLTKFNNNFEENNSLNNYKRESEFLEDPIFNTHQSETSMMRYIKKLERKDLSLNHSMISLGSCTMKLNAAAEMLPLSWSNWNNIHPFVPEDQAVGYYKVLRIRETTK